MNWIKDLIILVGLTGLVAVVLATVWLPRAAYEQGVVARRTGVRFDDNPYPPDRLGPLGYRAKWSAGWQEGGK